MRVFEYQEKVTLSRLVSLTTFYFLQSLNDAVHLQTAFDRAQVRYSLFRQSRPRWHVEVVIVGPKFVVVLCCFSGLPCPLLKAIMRT